MKNKANKESKKQPKIVEPVIEEEEMSDNYGSEEGEMDLDE